MVRVHVLEAQELKAMDTAMMGLVKGKSDPYAVLMVGNRRFQTKTIKETLNPRWNEVYEVTDNALLCTYNNYKISIQANIQSAFCIIVLIFQITLY